MWHIWGEEIQGQDFEGKEPLERPRSRQRITLKWMIRDRMEGGVDYIRLAKNRDKCQMNTEMNFGLYKMPGIF